VRWVVLAPLLVFGASCGDPGGDDGTTTRDPDADTLDVATGDSSNGDTDQYDPDFLDDSDQAPVDGTDIDLADAPTETDETTDSDEHELPRDGSAGDGDLAVDSDLLVDGDLSDEPDRVLELRPTADAGPDQAVRVGSRVRLNGLGSWDPGEGDLTFDWVQIDGDEVELSSRTVPRPVFMAPDEPTELVFQLVVQDELEQSSEPDEVRVVVELANHAPVADAGSRAEYSSEDVVYLDGSGSYDPDLDRLTYTWEQIEGPDILLSGLHDESPWFRAPDRLAVIEMRLTVSDGDLSDSATVQIGITNVQPEANAGDDIVLLVGEAGTLDGTGSDDRHDEISYQWEQLFGESVELAGPDTSRPTFVAPSEPNQLTFMLTVSDGSSVSEPDTVTVLVVDAEFTDRDGDFLSDQEETRLGTRLGNPDTDSDGIPDGWEVNGYEGIDYADIGCDPLHRDILVEIDYQEYESDGVLQSAAPTPAWAAATRQFFDELDIENADGTTGIHIWFFPDTVLDEDYKCYYPGEGTSGDVSDAELLYRHTFHKATFCIGGSNRGNSPRLGRSLKLVSPASNQDPDDDWRETAQFRRFSLFVHEIGHSLGLYHGGFQNMNHKVNYTSLMNYTFDTRFDDSPMTLRGHDIHFSDGSMPDIDECNLTEVDPFGDVPVEDLAYLEHYHGGFDVYPNGDVDWNGNGERDVEPYELVIRYQPDPAGCRLLRDHDDLAEIADSMAKAIPANPN